MSSDRRSAPEGFEPEQTDPGWPGAAQGDPPPGSTLSREPGGLPAFAHPPWTVGLVLVIAVVMLILGLLAHPLWLLIGSPFILALAVWAWVRTVIWRRRRRGLDRYGAPLEPDEGTAGED